MRNQCQSSSFQLSCKKICKLNECLRLVVIPTRTVRIQQTGMCVNVVLLTYFPNAQYQSAIIIKSP